LANLDLKYKQLTLEDNKESYSAKRRINTLEEELARVTKEKEDLIASRQADEVKSQQLVSEAKLKADLRIASIKKQFENEKAISSADLSGKCHELEARIKEQTNFIKDLKTECEDYKSSVSSMKAEMAKAIEIQIKSHEDLISELKVSHLERCQSDRAEIERLVTELELVNVKRDVRPELEQRKELVELEKQLEELRFTCDEIRDEKEQLISLVRELKEKNSSKF